MEDVVAEIFDNNNIEYRKEVYSSEWTEMTQALGDDEKRFDFVIETPQKIYLIEVNFYSGGGSKLNEVARAYSDIAPKSSLMYIDLMAAKLTWSSPATTSATPCSSGMRTWPRS